MGITTDQWIKVRKLCAVMSLLFFAVLIFSLKLVPTLQELSTLSKSVLFIIPVSLFCVAAYASYAESNPASVAPKLGIFSVLALATVMLLGALADELLLHHQFDTFQKICFIALLPLLFCAFSAAVSAPRLHVKYEGIRIATYITGLLIFFVVIFNICNFSNSSNEMIAASMLVTFLLIVALIVEIVFFTQFYLKCRKDFN